MIEVTIKLSGTFVDKPQIRTIMVDENPIAVERKNDETNKLEQLTVKQLFNAYERKGSYEQRFIEEENEISPDLFELWFNKNYLFGKGLGNNIISIEYKRI